MATEGFIIYPTYKVEEGKPYVYLYGRLKDGRSFCTKNYFRPYFYIKEEDLEKARKLGKFEAAKTHMKSFREEKLVKLVTQLPKEIPELRKKFEENNIDCFEADIRFEYRFMMDNDLKGTLKIEGDEKTTNEKVDVFFNEPKISKSEWTPKKEDLKIISIDIETSMNSKELYCISLYSNDKKLNNVLIVNKDGLKKAESYKDEKTLLEAFKKQLLEYDPDIITGWNLIDFDLKIIKEKMEKHKITFDLGRNKDECSLRIYDSFMTDSKADIPGRMVLDGIHMLKTSFIKLPDYKLDTAAKKFTDETKIIGQENKGEEIEDSYKNNPQKLVDYNLLDSKLTIDIINNSGAMALTIQRSLLTGMPLDRVRASIASFDSLYIRKLNKKGYAANTREFKERSQRTTGGYVMKSKPGIYDYVIVLDFKSLYPSLMITFNIDPLMHRPGCKKQGKEELIKAPNEACFSKEKGILPEILKDFWKEREKARKNKDELTRWAIKISMNSMYGVLASPNCRFYSFEMANAITSFARKMITTAAEKSREKGLEVIYGDSITKERFVTILNAKGYLEIKNIEELFQENKENIVRKRGKEFVTAKEIKALSLDKKTLKPKFSKIKTIIRHKTNKKTIRINQKYGETECTKDHSLIEIKDNKLRKITPENLIKQNKPFETIQIIPKVKQIKTIDLYEHLKKYSYKTKYKGRKKKTEFEIHNTNFLRFNWTKRKKDILLKRKLRINTPELESFTRLLGLYIAEGSSSTQETSKRTGASISLGDKKILTQIKKDYLKIFKNATASIIESDKKNERIITQNGKSYKYKDKTLKLQMMNNISGAFFKTIAGQTSKKKKIPEVFYHLPEKYKKLLLKYMIIGDGSYYDQRYTKEHIAKHFRYETSSTQLVSGISLLLKQMNIKYNIQYRPSKKSYRISTSNKNNTRLATKISEKNNEQYVYDISVEDENFVDSCGQVVLHNTDSIFVDLKVKDYKEAIKRGKEIEKEINKYLKKMINEDYEVESFLELEYEKTFRKFLMPKQRGSEEGAKKRYAGQLITEHDGKLTEKMDFTGLEFVRRDWTEVSKKFQLELLQKIFNEEEITEYVQDFIKDLKKGKYDELLVYRKALRKDVDEYTKTTPPHVKAARKLDKITSNIIDYIMTTEGPEPLQKVEHSIDYEHYIEKQIKPIADSVLIFYDTNFEDVIKGSEQTNLFDY